MTYQVLMLELLDFGKITVDFSPIGIVAVRCSLKMSDRSRCGIEVGRNIHCDFDLRRIEIVDMSGFKLAGRLAITRWLGNLVGVGRHRIL